ncbi:sugar ABC transporter substrate-binding protein [Aureimonas flava]|uniref:Sugar ABC transporter substrate-binding protein n=1 Tax=Aureimonas flava TaxID=2320271 RepID=A0A3A1WFZ8_9HYPH|nr:sugar ABC transporter substrate-binding protein [Aureimonas flava]RIX98160.1 sugar ABC transporter substrate-binding protein [Aureimonas flava]
MKILRRTFLAATLSLTFISGAAVAAPVTIDFWTAWDPGQADAKAAQAAIKDFEAANPDITIKPQVIAFDALHNKLVTAIAGGDSPDLSWGLIEWFGELNRMGALADLTDQMAAWPDRDAIYPNALKQLTVDGRLMALPNYLGLRALLYHSDMLKEAGLSSPPETWDALVDAAKTIREKTGKHGFGIAGRGVRSPQELLMYLAQNEVEIARLQSDGKYRNTWKDDPAELGRAAEVFAFYRRMLDEAVVPPQAAGWGWEEEDTNFALGQYAMAVNGSWMRTRTEQNPKEMADVLVAPPPAGGKPATFFEIAPIFVYKQEDPAKAEAVWKFASFMLGRDVQQKMFPDRSPRSDVEGDEVWGKPFTALTGIGVSFPPVALGSITRAMEDSVARVLLKNDAPETVAAKLGEAVNKSLRQSGQLSAE